MQFNYPRSFLKLILAGFALAVIPLVLALVYNAFAVRRLADHSERTLYQAVQATQASRSLIEYVTAMERSVRQFVIVGEPSVLQGYAMAHERFVETAERLNTYRLEGAQRGTLSILIGAETNLFQTVSQSAKLRSRAGAIVGGFGSIPGALLGCLLIGIIEPFADYYLPGIKGVSAYVVMLVVLFVRPEGLISQTFQKKV